MAYEFRIHALYVVVFFFLVSIPHGVDSYVTYTCNFFLCGDITYKCSFKSSSFILNIYTHTYSFHGISSKDSKNNNFIFRQMYLRFFVFQIIGTGASMLGLPKPKSCPSRFLFDRKLEISIWILFLFLFLFLFILLFDRIHMDFFFFFGITIHMDSW